MTLIERAQKIIDSYDLDIRKFANWQFFTLPVSIGEMSNGNNDQRNHRKNMATLKIDLLIKNAKEEEIDKEHYYMKHCKEWMMTNDFQKQWIEKYKNYNGER